jgi:hypothetical protein
VSDDALVAIITPAIAVVAGAIGIWLGLRLVKGSNLQHDRPRLNKITVGIWIAALAAVAAWLFSDGRLSFANACLTFVIASIAVFAAFSRPKEP